MTSVLPVTGSEYGMENASTFDAVNWAVTSAVTNSATMASWLVASSPLSVILEPPVPLVDLVEDVEHLPDRRPDGLAAVDELALLADVVVQVGEELLGHFDAYLGHTRRISEGCHKPFERCRAVRRRRTHPN